MQPLTVKIDFVNSLNLQLKCAARLPFINRNERVSFNLSKCLGNEISPRCFMVNQCKDNVKWVGNFYRSLLFYFFHEKFCLEQYANIILVTSSAKCISKQRSFCFGKMSNQITNAICQQILTFIIDTTPTIVSTLFLFLKTRPICQ